MGGALRKTNGVLTNIHPTPDGKFDVILEPGDGTHWWWWWFDQTATGIDVKAAQTGSQIIDVKSYMDLGVRRFVAIFVNDSDDETTRIGTILRSGNDSVPGFIEKLVGAPIERSLNADYAFDPASSMKKVVALHAVAAATCESLALRCVLSAQSASSSATDCSSQRSNRIRGGGARRNSSFTPPRSVSMISSFQPWS